MKFLFSLVLVLSSFSASAENSAPAQLNDFPLGTYEVKSAHSPVDFLDNGGLVYFVKTTGHAPEYSEGASVLNGYTIFQPNSSGPNSLWQFFSGVLDGSDSIKNLCDPAEKLIKLADGSLNLVGRVHPYIMGFPILSPFGVREKAVLVPAKTTLDASQFDFHSPMMARWFCPKN